MHKIGIYSGTFDPIHAGHVAFALKALEEAGLDKVYFLPEPRPRRKQGVKALEHRLNMVELAIADNPRLGTIVLDHARFSVQETWPKIKERFNRARLYMLMGDDVMMRLSDWPMADALTQEVTFLVGIRVGSEAQFKERIDDVIKKKGLKIKYQLFSTEQRDCMSSKIRLAIRRGEEPEGVDSAVRAYTDENGLYRMNSK